MRDVVDLLLVARLRISEKDYIKRIRFFDSIQGKVDRCGQRPRGFDAGEIQLRRSLRFMDVVESRNMILILNRAIPARLDHKYNRVIVHRQGVFAVSVCRNDFSTIGDFDVRQWLLIRVSDVILIRIQIDDTRGHLARRILCGQGVIRRQTSTHRCGRESGQ